MAQDFGNGVSRTLSALQRQFQTVVWQASKPPLDSELNLMSQMEMNRMAEVVRSQMHSGFLLDPMMADQDFVTNENWSNWFKLGRPSASEDAPMMWANVNGWHWKETNLTGWSQSRLKELLGPVVAFEDGTGYAKVTEVEKIEGDVTVADDLERRRSGVPTRVQLAARVDACVHGAVRTQGWVVQQLPIVLVEGVATASE